MSCDCGPQPHQTNPMWDPHWHELVEIDQLLRPLIMRMWQHGVRTWFCCQGSPGVYAYVTVDDAGQEAAEDVIGRMYIRDRNTTHDLGVVTICFDHARLHLENR